MEATAYQTVRRHSFTSETKSFPVKHYLSQQVPYSEIA
jgi:hypothetical protein